MLIISSHYNEIANKMADILMSDNSQEERSKQFAQLVNEKERTMLFSATLNPMFERMKQMDPEKAAGLLDKFIVNSLLTGMLILTGQESITITTEDKQKLVMSYRDELIKTRKDEDLFVEEVVESITLNAFYAAKLIDPALKDQRDEVEKYYMDNMQAIHLTAKKLGQTGNFSFDSTVEGLRAINQSKLTESEKLEYGKIFIKESRELNKISTFKPEKEAEEFMKSLMKSFSTMSVEEAKKFSDNVLTTLSETNIITKDKAYEKINPYFEANAIKSATNEIESQNNKPKL